MGGSQGRRETRSGQTSGDEWFCGWKSQITFPAGRLLNPGFGTHAVRPPVYFSSQAKVERREMEGIVDGRNQIQALTSMDRILTLPNQLHVLVDDNAS
jgi:hypothetical protein